MPSRRFTVLLSALVLAYVLTGWALALYYGVEDRFSILIYSRAVITTTGLLATLFFSAVVIRIMVVDRPDRLTRTIVAEMREKWFTRERIARGLPIVTAFLFFMAAFTSLKSMIPVVQGYAWDETFMKLDRLIHFGRDPWTLLQPVLGYPLVTSAVNFLYNMWFPVMFGVLYWQTFTLRHESLRHRYLLSFFLCWIVNGTILAMLLASVGPCFYGELRPDLDNPYQGLMAYLQETDKIYPVWALTAQGMLWSSYVGEHLTFGSGISAMPSLHVSVALLQTLLAYHINRRLGHVFAAFFAVILLGSVHLGWHYAVDGYLSIVTTLLIWWGVGKVRA